MVETKFKDSELGLIPEDWEVKKISEGIAEVKSGKRLPTGYYVTNNKTLYPYIRVIDMYKGGINMDNIMYVPEKAYPYIKNYRIFKEDIFISVAGTLGLVGKIPNCLDGANLTENANRFTKITCDRDYLLYYLCSPYIQDIIFSEQTIGAQPKLALIRIRNFRIVLPKQKKEQAAIATALNDVDHLITALDKKIEKRKLIKQGVMQQLLTGKKRLPGFTGKWVEKRLCEFCHFVGGGTPDTQKKEYWNGNIPWISSSDISMDDIYNISISRFITLEAVKNSATFICPPNTILLITRVGVGKLAISERLICTSQDFTNIIVLDANERFVALQLQTIMKQNKENTQGTSIKGITMEKVKELIITLPPTKEEQSAIAAILSDMDKEIEVLEVKRDKFKTIKQGMMQKLLTGQIRLI